MSNTVNDFQKNGYCIVKSAVSEELVKFITQYALFDEMQDFTPDTSQVVGAHAKYADPAMESMLLQLHTLMENNTGISLCPTYSFYRVYRPGDELVNHRDRPSCEISCTICFEYDYADKSYAWPIFLDGNAVTLEPGDLVIYRGCDLDHWREKFEGSDSNWHVQGFLHYVDANGPYANFKYDQRTSIGEVNKAPVSNVSPKSYISFTE
tara:strand:+ start:2231 stop:2854 length:624 start_codon:yes stop_codon:yes gene_type:complete